MTVHAIYSSLASLQAPPAPAEPAEPASISDEAKREIESQTIDKLLHLLYFTQVYLGLTVGPGHGAHKLPEGSGHLYFLLCRHLILTSQES